MIEQIATQKMHLLIKPLIGLRCCRKQIGYRRSLHLGFGKKIPNTGALAHKMRDWYSGEWEILTYESAWRVIKDGKIICASHDISALPDPDHPPDIDNAFRKIPFGRLISIQQKNKIDFKITFDSGISIELFAAASHGDEGDFIVIFCPWGKCLSVDLQGKWIYEDSVKK